MSDDEREAFHMNPWDFAPSRRKLTKEQQIYGMWADSDDEEEEEKEGRRGRRKDTRRKDYSTPIDFVAGGVHKPGMKTAEKEEDEEEEEDYEAKPSFAGAGGGSSSEEDDKNKVDEDLMAGMRKKTKFTHQNQMFAGGVGNWEKHTKGIGAKLLLQMGYQPGKGLGKSLQGISAPVTATLRKGRGAIGAYGPEAKHKKEEEAKEKAKAEKEETEKSHQWKKSTAKQKQRYFYRDAEDLIQEGRPSTSLHTQQSAAIARVPVIDLRGPEKRVLSGYHALRAAAPRYEDVPRKECSYVAVPELLHNLDLLVDMCEQDIIENHRESQTAEERQIALEKDKKNLEEEIMHSIRDIDIIDDIIDEIEKLKEPELSLDEVYRIYKKLQAKYPDEYASLGLGSYGAASGRLKDLMGATLASWFPLDNPAGSVTILQKWAPLLSGQALQELFWKPWLQQIQLAALEWNVHDPNKMKAVLDVWLPVAPDSEQRTILKTAIVPKIGAAVTRWNPTQDIIPIHRWLLPWHEYAGDLLEDMVYSEVRARLVNALSLWHPTDGSALAMLRPWSSAWSLALPTLVNTHIMPKLENWMRTIPVEPETNPAEMWAWCSCWQDMCGPRSLAAAAGRALLPRWLAHLAAWLNRRPMHAHLISYYSIWKGLFSEQLLREPEFVDVFRKALDMMNRSMDSPIQVPPPPPPPRISTSTSAQTIADVLASSNQQKSFTELLESRCMERGIGLLPIAGKSREGRPVFRIGSALQCYVIRNVIMYSNDLGRTFLPISLDALLQMASAKP